jgi:hypothetical protein
LAVRALLEDPPPFRLLEIGGPKHYSNVEVSELYARTAGIAPRIGHLPSSVAGVMARLARPLHPGAARILHLLSLPDDAFPSASTAPPSWSAASAFVLTSLEVFVERQVAAARPAAGPPHAAR